ncbi:MAG: redox-regulated ATPase YchF [Rickettsiales bacterium]|nr:redox-regulated ATPase YchF [Rickettsiales bacterium]
MGFKCGIVGLPNVGKSTLCNALSGTAAAEVGNYPFCTIEPNISRVTIQDPKLEQLAKIANSQSIIPTYLDIADIAGLVKGANKGEGLGNKFLAHIREVDAIMHVVRCFDTDDVTHVEDSIDPVRDIELIETELILADLESLEKRIANFNTKNKFSKDKKVLFDKELMEKCLEVLNNGFKIIDKIEQLGLQYDSIELKQLQLLTAKPYFYICNISEDEVGKDNNKYCKEVMKKAEEYKTPVIVISAKIEEEISKLPNAEEKQFFLESLNLTETGLNKVTRCGHDILNLQTFFTIGPKEARAWSIKKGTTAPSAAGCIHTDFEKGFIKAEVISFENYIQYNGELGAKNAGKLTYEGKEYIMKDGDVVHFRFNV